MFLLLIALCFLVSSPQTGMTLRRLRVREWEVTLLWSLVFAGYFLLFWAAQLGMLIWMFQEYAKVSGWGLMDLFLASFSSNYFHLILPLSEPWAVARNVFFCLSWGAVASLGSMEARHGGKPFVVMVFAVLTALFLPTDIASQAGDMAAVGVLGCLLAGYIFAVRGGLNNAD